MKTLLIILIFATSVSAQYANRIDSKQFTATHKVIGNDTIAGKWIVYITEEWGGAHHRMKYNGEFLYLKDGAYHSNKTTVTIDDTNQRIEVKAENETYYLIKKTKPEPCAQGYMEKYEFEGRKKFGDKFNADVKNYIGAKNWRQ